MTALQPGTPTITGTPATAAADGSAITATYELTSDDVAALAWYQAVNDFGYRYSRRRQAGSLAAIIVLSGAVFAATQDSLEQAMVPLGISILIAGYCAWGRYLQYPGRFARYAASRFRQAEAPGALGAHKLSVSGTGIHVVTDHFASDMRWSMIVKVVTTDSHIFAFTGPFNAVIIPRRSLQGAGFEEVRDAFLRYGPSVAIAAN